LKNWRNVQGISQVELANSLLKPQSYVAKVEGLERRIDIIELLDWLQSLGYETEQFLQDIGWLSKDDKVVVVPIPRHVLEDETGVRQQMIWQGQLKEVKLEGISKAQYLDVDDQITYLFQSLNSKSNSRKNRDIIAEALEYAVTRLPNLNPSDIYHHIVYRIYIREYSRSKAEQSWVRAGGEALELFIQKHYADILASHGIEIQALISSQAKAKALQEMGLAGQVGDSKLDVALYGNHGEKRLIFGGIHSKASLAERVSDDVPCSEAMMRKGFVSILYTFDAKSFPPPHGDLVNRGELGSNEQPSDKRKYIEEHGSFDACFSYNLRSIPSIQPTPSGKRIFVSSLNPELDALPKFIIEKWNNFIEDREK
jgi:hypothetical protein